MICRSKLSNKIILALGGAELLLSQADIIRQSTRGGITHTQRVSYGRANRNLASKGYVVGHRENQRSHLFELTQLGETLYMEWKPALRICRVCKLEAKDKASLKMFKKDSRSRYGRVNICKDCAANS